MIRLFSYRPETAEVDPRRRHSPLENAYETKLALEAPVREAVKKRLWEKEAEIAIWAADTYCDLHPEFNSPKGSLRRKKGYEDGRHVVRAIGNCIRVNAAAPLLEDILSWFAIGDPAFRVTAKDVEYFLSFVHQGCRQVLPDADKPILDQLMEDAKKLCRLAGSSWELKSKAPDIASRMTELLQSAKSRLVPQLQGWLREEDQKVFEAMTVALAELLAKDPQRTQERWANWLVENVLTHTSYPVEIFRFYLSAMEISIVEALGTDCIHRVEPLLNHARINAPRLVFAGTVCRLADYTSHKATQKFIDLDSTLDGLSVTSFAKELHEAGVKVLHGLATLYAADHLNPKHPHVAQLWCDRVLPFLPLPKRKSQVDFLLTLLEIVKEQSDSATNEQFIKETNFVFHMVESCDTATKLLKAVDHVPDSVSGIDQPTLAAAVSPRNLYITSLLHSAMAQGDVGVSNLRRWVYDFVFPRLTNEQSNGLLQQWSQSIQAIEDTDAAKVLTPFVDGAKEAFRVWKERPTVLAKGKEAMEQAVARCYEVVPNHPARANGQKVNGRRDGMFLLEEILRTQAMGKTVGKARLLEWYRNEIAWTSTLPAKALDAFLDGLVFGLIAHTQVADALKDLKTATSAFTAAQKIYQHHTQVSKAASDVVIQQMPEFDQQIGTKGRNAFYRDNAMTLRALATALVHLPDSGEYFSEWFTQSVTPYIKVRNNDVVRLNLNQLAKGLQKVLDEDEQKSLNRILLVMGSLLQVKSTGTAKKLVAT